VDKGADFVFEKAGAKYLVELKVSSEGRSDADPARFSGDLAVASKKVKSRRNRGGDHEARQQGIESWSVEPEASLETLKQLYRQLEEIETEMPGKISVAQ
jgi:hypothetical protein